jgi:phage terminase small subunit
MLNDKQKLFINEYVKNPNATQAAIAAGYSKKTAGSIGDENLKKPEIKEEILRRQAIAAAGAEVDAIWLNTRLRQMVERCMTAEPVYDKQGNPTGEYRFDSAGANKALDMLAKRIGFYEEDNKQKKTEAVIDLGGYSYEQLIALRNKKDAGD